jgi:hypothetical protein
LTDAEDEELERLEHVYYERADDAELDAAFESFLAERPDQFAPVD